jgi:hypothetical protein
VAGGGGALVAAGLAGSLALSWPSANTFQVAAPPPADCSGPMSSSTAPEWLAHRLTCYLTDAVPAALPRGSSVDPFEAVPDGDLVRAGTVVRDAAGTGSLTFGIAQGDPQEAADAVAGCATKDICTPGTGPNGETVQVFDAGVQPLGGHNYTVYVYAGDLFAMATASNTPDGNADGRSTREAPPLTVAELVTLLTSPALLD